MNKDKRFFGGYSIASVIFLLSIITFTLISGMMWINFYLNVTSLKLRHINKWDDLFNIFKSKVLEEFKKENKDDFTSPFEGWFSELPDKIDGYTVKYAPEDSKIDINYIDFTSFFPMSKDQSGDSGDYFSKIINEPIYSYEDLKNYLNPDLSNDNENKINDIISIYLVPNINTASIEKIKNYLMSNDIDAPLIRQFTGSIESYRKNIDYLKFQGAKNKKGGLIIDTFEFENLNKLSWPKDISLFELFDYKGRINLNFVNEEVFKIAYKACMPKKYKYTYKYYWDKIYSYRLSKRTIKQDDIKNIFKDNWKIFEKIFSINSSHFKIEIIKDDKILTVYLRKYKEREFNFKILKISAGRYDK